VTSRSSSVLRKLAARVADPATATPDTRVDELLRLADDLRRVRQDPAPEDPPGRLGPFVVLRPLGRGGFGRVYLARDERTGREVALKLPMHVDDECRQRLVAEARAVAKLDHPNIVTLLEVGEYEGRACLVYVFVAGATLADWIEAHGGPAPVPLAIDLVLQIADAVAHAHRHGVLHRDLKPSNVLLSARGDGEAPAARVLDFGLARAVGGTGEALTPTGHAVGTPPYAAPEQLLGSGTPTSASDVFSLGMILAELLSGRPPDADSVYRPERPDVGRLLPAARCPRDLAAFVGRCLAFEPGARPQSATDFAAELERLKAPRPWWRPRRQTRAGLARRRPRRPGLLLIAGVALSAGWFGYGEVHGWLAAQRLLGASAASAPGTLDEVRPWLAWAERHFRSEVRRTDVTDTDRTYNAWLGLVASSPDAAVSEVLSRALRRAPAELQALGAVVAPYHATAAPSLWAVTGDGSRPHSERLAAAALLAVFPPERESHAWNTLAAELTPGLTQMSESAATPWFELLTPVRAAFEAPLGEIADRKAKEEAGRVAAAGLALLWADDQDRLLKWLARCEPVQLRRLSDALRRTDGATEKLTALAAGQTPPPSSGSERVNERLRVNAALTLTLQDQSAGLDALFRDVRDPTPRTRAYYGLPAVGVDPIRWTTRALDDWERADADVLFGRVLCVAKLARDLAPTGRGEVARLLEPVYERHPDAGVHAAAAYALGIAAPDVLDHLTRKLAGTAPEPGRRWFHGPEGHVFAVHQLPEVNHRFALAIYSTTNAQFSRYQPGHLARHTIPTLKRPGQPVGWAPLEEMLGYCNWLNARPWPGRGRLKHQSFRPPTPEELQFAARGQAATRTSCGDDLDLLSDFAGFAEDWPRIAAVEPVALAPNRLGMADLIGNMQQLAVRAGAARSPDTFLFGFPYRKAKEGAARRYCEPWQFPIHPEYAQTVTFRIATTLD
jgi:hypothetical protein